ncbi:MAG: hypothetical protein ABR606_12275 [Vicinamibacterales bacterium]
MLRRVEGEGRLRAIDNRYGLNWKRGVVGDMSQDVIAYNYADVPDFQATARHIHAWDAISGHCGGSPSPNAGYLGNPAGQAGWTNLPYLRVADEAREPDLLSNEPAARASDVLARSTDDQLPNTSHRSRDKLARPGP